MSEDKVINKQELLDDIEREWTRINQFLDSLSDEQWTGIKNPDGWTIKDHVAHLSAWEQSIIAFFTGVPRYDGLGVSEALYMSHDIDAVNHAIFLNHREDSLADVRVNFAATHDKLMGHINTTSNEDMQKPYSHFLPFEPGDGDGPPAIQTIHNNTAGHYDEHMPWMEAMFDQ